MTPPPLPVSPPATAHPPRRWSMTPAGAALVALGLVLVAVIPARAQPPVHVAETNAKPRNGKADTGKAGAAKPAAPKPEPQPAASNGGLGPVPGALLPFPQLDTVGGSGDLAYGAYQRGYYLTAFHDAEARAKAQNDPVAMTLLAELYARGFGVRYDPKKAIEWYQKAAAAGSADAEFALGLMALTGQGMTASEEEAARRFRVAAEKGNPAAAYNLGLLYMQGRKVRQDMSAAARWFEKAAEKDQEDAQYALAVLLKEGNGVDRDVPGAAQLMGRAAKLGHTTAQVEFAIMQFNGVGVPKDEAAAAALFRRAALGGNIIAQNRYARLLAAGRGTAADPVAAVTWHLMAKGRGLGDPMLDKVADQLSPADREKAQAQARRWSGEPPASPAAAPAKPPAAPAGKPAPAAKTP
ncbi:tetratricopeptide repeat protein [Xanthobacter sp. V4C-4]|uniref:tetratricopeptide repeat protein n=1 Tax=Xanthobacter cornucopiae TaxID=3119924 RepID=UPI003727499C